MGGPRDGEHTNVTLDGSGRPPLFIEIPWMSATLDDYHHGTVPKLERYRYRLALMRDGDHVWLYRLVGVDLDKLT